MQPDNYERDASIWNYVRMSVDREGAIEAAAKQFNLPVDTINAIYQEQDDLCWRLDFMLQIQRDRV